MFENIGNISFTINLTEFSVFLIKCPENRRIECYLTIILCFTQITAKVDQGPTRCAFSSTQYSRVHNLHSMEVQRDLRTRRNI